MIMEILLMMMNKKQIKMEGNLFFIYSHKVGVLNEKRCNVNVHFIGLVSNGGINSHQEHLYRLCEITNNYDVSLKNDKNLKFIDLKKFGYK